MISQQQIEDILQRPGEARGAVFSTDADFVLKQVGADGLAKVEKQLFGWGVNLKYGQVKTMGWYKVGWRTLSILAIKEALGWSSVQIREMGLNAPRASIIVKLFFKLFPDMEKFAKQIPSYWRKHYTVGELTPVRVDINSREIILYLKKFSFHPLQCKYYEGYFEGTVKLTRPRDSLVSAKELECSFKDNSPYEVYQLKWTS